MRQAMQHHQAGRLPQAQAIYRDVLAEQPRHAEAVHLLGVLALQTARSDIALRLINQAIEISPKEPTFHSNLGNVFWHLKQWDRAATSFQEAVKLKPDYAEAHSNLGDALRALGQLDDAIAAYRTAIKAQPSYARAHSHLSVALVEAGQSADAVVAAETATQLHPNDAQSFSNLGNALREGGRLGDAITAFQTALRHAPKLAEAHNNLGNALKDQGRLSEAIAAYKTAIGLDPAQPDFHNNLASVLRDQGKTDDAVAEFRAAIKIDPAHADAHTGLADLLCKQDRFEDAVASYQLAIKAKPKLSSAHNNLGNALRELGRTDEAIAAYHNAIAIKPTDHEAHLNLGKALRKKGTLDDAMAAYEAALQIKPNFANAFCCMGNVLTQQGKLDEAVALYHKALQLDPNLADAHGCLASTLTNQGLLDDAVAAFHVALSLKPDHAEAHCNLGLTLLMQGDFVQGWKEHEWRWKCKDFPNKPRNFPQPQWDGGDLAGKTILLHAEQGLGDTLQFIRYVPMVAARGAKIVVECQKSLLAILRASPDFACVEQWITPGAVLPTFDVHCPMLSLPILFNTAIDNMPVMATGYVKADSEKSDRWREKLAKTPPDLRVGLVWAGNPAHGNDRNRSISLAALAPLASVAGVRFYSLQKGPAADQAKNTPAGFAITDLSEQLTDFTDTAAIIANLDLIITVDTAVAHLAGAMGKQAWVMLPFSPDWRWMMHREDSPWYPQMRLFRQQTIGAWPAVIERIRDALAALVNDADQAGKRSRGTATPVISTQPDPHAVTSTPHIAALMKSALHHHQSGELPLAQKLYREVLALNPRHVDALHLLGVVALQTNRADIALKLIRQAIDLSAPGATGGSGGTAVALFHSHLAEAHAHLGQSDQAIAAYRTALALSPANADVRARLGGVLRDKKRYAEAIAEYQHAIRLKPDSHDFQMGLGNTFFAADRLDEAIAAYREAVRLKPDYAQAHSNLGNALKENDQLDEAIAAYRTAVQLQPHLPEVHSNLGNALCALRQHAPAIAAYREAIRLRPDYADAHCNLGNALRDQGKLDEAMAAYRTAIQLTPGASDSQRTDAHNNLGRALRDAGQIEESVAASKTALQLKPDHPDAHFNYAMTLLLKGDLTAGWPEYEWRSRCKEFPSAYRQCPRPRWAGENLRGRTILLHAEQGLGDTLQFIRYAPLVAQRGARVVVACQPPLQRLLQNMHGVHQWLTQGQPVPHVDFYCPLLSLPLAFETTLDSIPSTVPYIKPETDAVQRWQERLAKIPAKRRVGLVWAGNPDHKNDHNRSISLNALSPLTAAGNNGDVRFFSLQKGSGASQSKTPPQGMPFTDWTEDLTDFADTAALMANLDLIITVDTAVAHLAGAMGKPTWVLLPFAPDWRWLVERDDSPWYPTMRLFRQQSPGDWKRVINKLSASL